MSYCTLCNGMAAERHVCRLCMGTMIDQGKVYDFYDDYSPYMEIEWNQLVDGDPQSTQKPECVHLFICVVCGTSHEITIVYAK
ncbi:hypothetical protein ACFSCZ_11275 [Siminovitchia sediminis]|uniref:Uncharacterized protein n=1 Tax=Siminovitchia sediminis TaxID=1274353 RepID=A0ABW4KIX7_9BACI